MNQKRIVLECLEDQIYDDLRRRILRHELAPGSLLSTKDLCAEYGVSVTPVKEALALLNKDGLATVKPRGSSFVSELGREKVIEELEARAMIERHAIEKGVETVSTQEIQQLDDLASAILQADMSHLESKVDEAITLEQEFHTSLVALGRNQTIVDIYVGLHMQWRTVRLLEYRPRPEAEVRHAQHRAILRAYADHDVTAARQAFEDHLVRTKSLILTSTAQGAIFAGEGQ